MWIFKTADNSAPLGDFSNVTDYGVFSSTLSNWIFPDTAGPPIQMTLINSSQIDEAFFGSFDLNHLILGQTQTAAIPEPGSMMLLVGGILAMTIVRRKNRV